MPSPSRIMHAPRRLRLSRSVDAAVRALLHPRAQFQWVARRQTIFATRIRTLLYGHKARPLGRIRRLSWKRLTSFYTRSRMLKYAEVWRIAMEFASELRATDEILLPTDEVDARLREMLSKRLTAAAKEKEAAPWAVSDRDRKKAIAAAWAEQWVKEVLILGICVSCGNDLPCEPCNVPLLEPDGRGGFRARAALADAETLAKLRAVPIEERLKLLQAELDGPQG